MKHLVLVTFFLLGLLAAAAPADAAMQTLEDVLAQAYQSNPGLQARRAELRAVDERVAQALAGWRPNIETSAEIGKGWDNIASGPFKGSTATTPRDVSVSVIQPVFRGFRTVGSVREAEALVLSQRAVVLNAEQQLLLTTARAYLDVVRAVRVLGYTRENEQILRRLLNATNTRFRAREVTRTDLNQAEARLSDVTASRAQAEADLASARATFARLTGDMPRTLEQPALKLEMPKDIDDTVALALKQSPSVLAARSNDQAARENVTVTDGSLLPEVDIVGSSTHGWAQTADIPGREDTSSIVARLTFPLYQGGAEWSASRAARQTVTQRRLELEDARNAAREAAIAAWQALAAARASTEAYNLSVRSNDRARYGVEQEALGGTRTVIEILNAQQEALNARVNFARAEHDQALAMLQVKAAIGELTAQALHLPVKLYDMNRHYENVRDKWFGFGDNDE